MKHSKISAIAIAFSTLFAGQAMAADVQTKANGYEMVTESGLLAKDVFSANYPAPQLKSLTRAEVRAELAESIANGNTVVSESGLRANEVFSSNYSTESASSKTRAEVRAELAEAIENGLFDEYVSA